MLTHIRHVMDSVLQGQNDNRLVYICHHWWVHSITPTTLLPLPPKVDGGDVFTPGLSVCEQDISKTYRQICSTGCVCGTDEMVRLWGISRH